MSKRWESKSVEEQQAEAATPKANDPDNRAAKHREEADRKRRIQTLEMQRERVLSERTSSPHRRSALELALKEIEHLLQELGWSLKL